MEHRKINKTLEIIASKNYTTENELFDTILTEIINYSNLSIHSAAYWSLSFNDRKFKHIKTLGKYSNLKFPDINVEQYDYFKSETKERIVVLNNPFNLKLEEDNNYFLLLGVGERTIIEMNRYYDKLILFITNDLNDDIQFVVNIIATIIGSKLQQQKLGASERYLISEIEKAQEIQRSILPDHEFKFLGYQLFGVTVPAELIGGDFFDYLPMGDDNERIAVIVGDVASHGLSAAAEAMYISGAIRMASGFQIKISSLLKRTNQLVNKIFADDKFCSLFYGEITKNENGLFLYASAGHNPPIFITADKQDIKYLKPTGPVLGPAKNARYDVDHLNFNIGDVLLIYSDGISEANDENYNFFGDKRVEQILKESIHLTPKEICYNILTEVMKFSSNHRYNDDKTIVVIKRYE
ncbi:MAG TPA: PP2C family protein-serine/threonine phosphatase [Ignavibacteriales bacterium]|nr:PP2C family protein-serine/threonine phosphatase [Ignavibacteriales bacterium]HRT99415.1 PP2C family protein-serine/threonine phosphatase [Ignavibacteriales bacterium]